MTLRPLPPPEAAGAAPRSASWPSPWYTGALRTCSISRSGRWMPSATATTSTLLPMKRLRSTSLSAAMMTPSAWLTSLSDSTFSAPIEPWVSTFMLWPSDCAA
ncbi:hypothetical protein SANTM175S_01047 [Streptomyces antimycoticus]